MKEKGSDEFKRTAAAIKISADAKLGMPRDY